MLTKEELGKLEVGDTVETDYRILKGMAGETIKLRVVQVSDKHDKVEFVPTYFGITLGRWVATVRTEGSVGWSL